MRRGEAPSRERLLTLTEFFLLMRGLKFSESLRKVISSSRRNLFMPSNRDEGLQGVKGQLVRVAFL